MTLRKKIPAAAVIMSVIMSLAVFIGCSREEDKSKYDHLKTDIVGAWCDEAGPEAVETEGGTALKFYEFTEAGQVYYYYAYEDMGAVYFNSEYFLDGNLFNSEGSMCRINVEDDILTMTYDAGTSRYRRVSAAELLEYDVYAHGEVLYAEQEPILMGTMQQESVPSETAE